MAKQNKRLSMFQKRFRRWQMALESMCDNYEAAHPDWIKETVLELVVSGLNTLRTYINRGDPEVTWDNPIAELQYPLDWNWEAYEKGDPNAAIMVAARLSHKSMGNKKSIQASVIKAFFKYRNQQVL